MRFPYLKLLRKIGPFFIYQMSGNWIRLNKEPNFTNFGQHFQFPFIPKFEFWQDVEAVPDEELFFDINLLAQWKLMNQGVPLKEALQKANGIEKAERLKADADYIQFHNAPNKQQEVVIRSLGKIGDISIDLVNERLVRDLFFVGFTEGGHDLVYPFIPPFTLWIGNDILKSERFFTIFHEYFERYLMSKGFSYLEAHELAIHGEWRLRQAYSVNSSRNKPKS